MRQEQAEAVARAFGGEAWHSGGGIWLVRIRRADGLLVVLSDEIVCEYPSEDAFDAGKASREIALV